MSLLIASFLPQMQRNVGTEVEDLSMHLASTLDVQLFVLIAQRTGSLLASPNHHFVP